MKKILALLLAFVLLFAFAAVAESAIEPLASQAPALRPAFDEGTTITVNGASEVLIPADTAVVTLGVTYQAEDVLEAQSYVNAKIAAIRAALIAAGIAETDINTDQLRIYASYDYSGNVERIVGYNASSTLAIRSKDMTLVGTIVDTAFAAGANRLDNIGFSAEDSAEANDQALTEAVADAMHKAQIIASAAGKTIVSVDVIGEGYAYSYDSGVNNFSMKAEAAVSDAAGTLVQSAKIGVSAQVTVSVTAK